MRVLVTGSRDWAAEMAVWLALEHLRSERGRFTVVHGACQDREGNLLGADLFAQEWADLHGFEVDPYPADWLQYGRAAGPIRNKVMVDTLVPGQDVVLAFQRNYSRGTQSTINLAQAVPGLEVIVTRSAD